MLLPTALLLATTSITLALAPAVQGAWDFSRYPAQGQSAPAPVNPKFTQRYNISGISNTIGLKGTGVPASAADGVCPVLPAGVPSQCDWRCDRCNSPSDVLDCGRPGVWGLSIDDGM